MKRSSILLSIVCFVSIASSNADALDFGDHFYGKANFSVGYAYQKDKSKGITDLTDNAESNYQHVSIGTGFDVYYKACDIVHPFVGLDFEGRIPVKTYVMKEHWRGENAKDLWKINDFFSAHLKLGARINLTKEFALQPYGLIGFNLLQTSTKAYNGYNQDGVPSGHSPVYTEEENHKFNYATYHVGLSTGVGINVIYDVSKKFAIFGAVEYQYHNTNNVNNYHHLYYYKLIDGKYYEGSNAEEWTGTKKVNYRVHQIGVKIGIQFL